MRIEGWEIFSEQCVGMGGGENQLEGWGLGWEGKEINLYGWSGGARAKTQIKVEPGEKENAGDGTLMCEGKKRVLGEKNRA